MHDSTYIYAIESDQLQLVKVGYSQDPENRIEQLQQGCPVKLAFLAVWRGTMDQEQRIHRQLDEYRVIGEWFRIIPAQAIKWVNEIIGYTPIWIPQRQSFHAGEFVRSERLSRIPPPDDVLGEFTMEMLKPENGAYVKLSDAYAGYLDWCGSIGCMTLSLRTFAKELRNRGVNIRTYGAKCAMTIVDREYVGELPSRLQVFEPLIR